jgi:hypothetical protein
VNIGVRYGINAVKAFVNFRKQWFNMINDYFNIQGKLNILNFPHGQ